MSVSAEMPKYQSHKTVWALKIGNEIKSNADGTITLSIVDEGYASVVVDKEVVARYMPIPGDYYVVYQDGYKSISPAKAFEDGYTRV